MTQGLEVAANLATAVSIVLAARNSIHTWWTGIVGCALFGVVFFAARLYADVMLQAFFVATSAAGWWQWLRGNHGRPLAVARSSLATLVATVLGGGAATVAYGALLHHYTDAYAPFADSAVLSFSVVAQLLLMRRRVETWVFWLVVNTISVPLFASRGLYLTSLLYAGYWVNAAIAWPRWRRRMRGGRRRRRGRGFGMSKAFRRGLVVGKFCPLHRGHELLIDRAAASCDEVVVVSYTKPEFDGCGPAVRERWLAARFPTATVLVLDDASLDERCRARGIASRSLPHNDADPREHRALVAWLCTELLETSIDAVFTSEPYGDALADALTGRHGRNATRAAAVRHVCVDSPRAIVPISATAIRAAPHAYRQFLAPDVYRCFVTRICFLGAESSGKSTLAAGLAARLGTRWTPEYGRELWERRAGMLEYEDMPRIAIEQVDREERSAAEANRWLFCDTSPLTTVFYSLAMFGAADPELRRLAARRYDRVFLCAPDFPLVQDGTRRDEAFRARQHDWYVAQLRERGIAFETLRGDVERRAAAVAEALGVQLPPRAPAPSRSP